MANWALVIGINEYQRLTSLRYAQRDAELMRNYFNKANFDAVFYFADDSPAIDAPDGSRQSTQPTCANLYSFLHDFFEASHLAAGDNFWFFFSGHGMRHEGRDYLMPSDGNPRNIAYTAISVGYITERLRRCGADNVVLFLDACRNENDGAKSGVVGLEEHQGVITIASCSPSQQSYEIEAIRQGSFTYALLEALQVQGEYNCATVERLYNRLRYRVAEINRHYSKPHQTPYTIVEPATKYHLILLPQQATDQDIATLREDALTAEAEGNLELAEQLWFRVLAISPQNAAARQGLRRVIAKQLGQFPTPPAPTPNASGKKSTVASPPPPKPKTPPPEPEVELKSAKGIDYTQLRDLLKAQKWKEADQETARVMLKVANREKERWLDVDSINNFPCEDLRTIDQLWVRESNGHFGFSVQKKIWEDCGGKVDYETECKLADRVGWRKGGEWVNYSDLNFSLESPRGHLPLGGVDTSRWGVEGEGSFYVLVFLCGLLSRKDL
jgi:uncharacterized caspase-like protein